MENSTDICYAVSVPKLTDNAFNNLKLLIDGKSKILKKVFDTDNLDIETDKDTLTFNWLPANSTREELQAFTVFISKLCELAKTLKRVNLKEKNVENEKYNFRCFLIRLNMIGPEYKKDRAILLSRLEGSSSFKNKKGGKDGENI